MFKHITTNLILWTASDAEVNDAVNFIQNMLNWKLPMAVQHHICGSGQCKQRVDRGKNKTIVWGWGRTCIDAEFTIKWDQKDIQWSIMPWIEQHHSGVFPPETSENSEKRWEMVGTCKKHSQPLPVPPLIATSWPFFPLQSYNHPLIDHTFQL